MIGPATHLEWQEHWEGGGGVFQWLRPPFLSSEPAALRPVQGAQGMAVGGEVRFTVSSPVNPGPSCHQLSASCSDCTSLQDGRSQPGKPSKGPGADPGHQPGGLPRGRVPTAPSLVLCLGLGEELNSQQALGQDIGQKWSLLPLGLLRNQGGNNRQTCFFFPSTALCSSSNSSTDPQPPKATLQSRGDTSSCTHFSGPAPWPLQLPAPWQPSPRGLRLYPSHPHWAGCCI